MSFSQIAPVLILFLLLSLQLIACSNLTQDNFDKIKVGMGFQEVERLLYANPDCKSAVGVKTCVWGTSEKFIKVQFVDDKVTKSDAQGFK